MLADFPSLVFDSILIWFSPPDSERMRLNVPSLSDWDIDSYSLEMAAIMALGKVLPVIVMLDCPTTELFVGEDMVRGDCSGVGLIG